MLQQKRFVTLRAPSLWLICGAIDSPLLTSAKAPAALAYLGEEELLKG